MSFICLQKGCEDTATYAYCTSACVIPNLIGTLIVFTVLGALCIIGATGKLSWRGFKETFF